VLILNLRYGVKLRQEVKPVIEISGFEDSCLLKLLEDCWIVVFFRGQKKKQNFAFRLLGKRRAYMSLDEKCNWALISPNPSINRGYMRRRTERSMNQSHRSSPGDPSPRKHAVVPKRRRLAKTNHSLQYQRKYTGSLNPDLISRMVPL
jgi:hypothetical protein